VTGSVEDSDSFLSTVLGLVRYYIRRKVLGNTTRFSFYNVALSNSIEQSRFAVVDVTHNYHDWRSLDYVRRVLFVFFAIYLIFFPIYTGVAGIGGWLKPLIYN